MFCKEKFIPSFESYKTELHTRDSLKIFKLKFKTISKLIIVACRLKKQNFQQFHGFCLIKSNKKKPISAYIFKGVKIDWFVLMVVQ